MTDLQCPATAVLLEDQVLPPPWLKRLPVAASFEAPVPGTADALVEESADLFRGETFVIRAPLAELVEILQRRGLAGTIPALLEVDSEGWRRIPLPH
ncbi:hypothetical protein H9638_06615 [Arthrobacter sp. Sa2BUA2]|uniref:Uncharacterized protein n=1 Tax=Arthrobacter pullicola TaxID=2762224 RepID=A0ABR8YH63_9MICC|nr:hypothetical protein [Arthrobacter pullicola]MBD8043481.1 hypothetical protein [Arthrobacter pullicola]